MLASALVLSCSVWVQFPFPENPWGYILEFNIWQYSWPWSFDEWIRSIEERPRKSGPCKLELREDFYEIIQRRKLSLSECGLCIYLRGKSCRFGNPFKLANKTLYKELNTTRRIVDPLKASLQLKGVIKYNSGIGTGNHTEYTMLDSVMIHKRDKKWVIHNLSTGY